MCRRRDSRGTRREWSDSSASSAPTAKRAYGAVCIANPPTRRSRCTSTRTSQSPAHCPLRSSPACVRCPCGCERGSGLASVANASARSLQPCECTEHALERVTDCLRSMSPSLALRRVLLCAPRPSRTSTRIDTRLSSRARLFRLYAGLRKDRKAMPTFRSPRRRTPSARAT